MFEICIFIKLSIYRFINNLLGIKIKIVILYQRNKNKENNWSKNVVCKHYIKYDIVIRWYNYLPYNSRLLYKKKWVLG